jgi:hypothetical protein
MEVPKQGRAEYTPEVWVERPLVRNRIGLFPNKKSRNMFAFLRDRQQEQPRYSRFRIGRIDTD